VVRIAQHATYPAAHTRIEKTQLQVAAGRFDVVHYSVAGEQRIEAWFARNLPGPPVRFELHGKARLMAMELVDHRPGGVLDDEARGEIGRSERFGPLWLGRAVTAVVAAIGEPGSKTPIEDWDATGERISTWTWPAKGLTAEIDHSSAGKPTSVASFTLEKGAPWRSLIGVGLGSTIADVKHWYGPYRDQDSSKPGRFVAGSLYGGIVFGIDGGVVSRVFVGASAE